MPSNLSPKLARWAQQKSEEGLSFSSLGEIVLGVSRLRYFLYRTRFMLVNVTVRMILHVLEFILILRTMPDLMLPVMLLRLSSVAIESGWWGALDSMRYRIRQLKSQQQTEAIRHEIGGWVSASYLAGGSIVVFALLAAMLVFTDAANMAWLIVAVGVQTALRVIARTYYSGAYALKRVYFPFELIIAIEVAVFLVGLLAHGTTAGWTLPLCVMAASLCSTMISYRYARRVTDFLRITPDHRFQRSQLRSTIQQHHMEQVVQGGIAMLLMRLQDLALIAVLHRHANNPNIYALMVGLYLTMPLLRSAMNWSNIMFYDLTRYQYDIFKDFRTRFERLGMLYSLLIATVYAVCACLIMHTFTTAATPYFYWVITYFLLSGALGFLLMSLFARRAYCTVMLVCCLQYALLFVAGQFYEAFISLLLISVGLPIVVAWMALRRSRLPTGQTRTSFMRWRSELVEVKRPAALYILRFHPETPAHFKRTITSQICQMVPLSVQIFYLGNRLCISHIGEVSIRIENETFVMLGGGYIQDLEYLHAVSGIDLLQQAEQRKLIPSEVGDHEIPINELVAGFIRLFPDGVVQYPMHYNRKLAAILDSRNIREIIQAAFAITMNDKVANVRRYFVTTAQHDGVVEAIFLVEKDKVCAEARQEWRTMLEAHHRLR